MSDGDGWDADGFVKRVPGRDSPVGFTSMGPRDRCASATM